MGGHGLDSSGLEQGPVSGSWEFSNEISSCITWGFLN